MPLNSDSPLDDVKKQIDEAAALIQDSALPPHDYSSLREHVLQLELTQEIAALRDMLAEPATFHEKLKARFALRASDKDKFIPFNVMPESATNLLYFKIAMQLFKPKTTQELLNILLPGMSQLVISLSEVVPPHLHTPEQLRTYANESLPFIFKQTSSFAEDKGELTPDFLSECVFADKMLLDIQDIARFPLRMQARLQTKLRIEYPTLAAKLDAHNTSWRQLADDIQTIQNKGTSPKTAIQRLIQGLILSGSRMTGSEAAGDSSYKAIKQFTAYFYSLPLEIQTHLRQLKAGRQTLNDILENEIDKGQCVETTSSHLTKILEENSHDPVLLSSPVLTASELRGLEKKYGGNGIETKKDILLSLELPADLTKEALKKIQINTLENMIVLILNFPPVYYELMFQHLDNKKIRILLDRLPDIINQGFFNTEQKQGLAKAIIDNCARLDLVTPLLHWAAKLTDPVFLKTVLSHYPEADRLAAVQTKDQYGNTLLHSAAENPASLKMILDLYPEADRLAAVQTKDQAGNAILHSAANNPASLKMILDLYPEADKLAAVQTKDHFGQTVLYRAANNPASLKMILELYPEADRLAAVQTKDRSGDTVLHWATENLASLKMLLELLPEPDRLTAVQTKDEAGNAVLHKAAHNSASLEIILKLLPEADRLTALQTKDRYDDMVLHKAALHNPASLKMILELLPEAHRLAAVQAKNQYGDTILHRAAANPASLKMILDLYPEADRLAAVQTKDHIDHTVLHDAACNPASLKMILDLYPEADRLAAVQTKDQIGNTVLHKANQNPASLKMILDLYPEADRLATVQTKNQYGNTVLHMADDNPASLKMILELLSEPDRLTAVQTKDEVGNTALHRAAHNPASLKIILELLPEADRLTVVQAKNQTGNAVLHIAAEHPASLKMILELLPKAHRLTAVQAKTKDGNAVLHMAAKNHASLKMLLELYPEADRLAAVQAKNQAGDMVLHRAVGNPASLKMMLELLPEADRLTGVQAKNQYGDMVLHRAAQKPAPLKIIFASVPEDHYLALLKINNDECLNIMLDDTRYKIMPTDDPKLVNSFLPDYINIHKLFKDANSGSSPLLFSARPGDGVLLSSLKDRINNCQTFNDVKGYLLSFMGANQEHAFTKTLLKHLAPEDKTTTEGIKCLQDKWKLSDLRQFKIKG